MAEYGGYTGRILFVDLSAENITELKTEDYIDEWYGGRGIGAKIHWDMVGPEVKAFDPENVLSFMGGPATGVIDTRLVVQAVTPNGYPVQSYFRSTMGSHFGAELKQAGWDGIVFVGKAPDLTYLLIEDDRVELRSANEIRQMDTYATQQHLWSRHTKDHKVCLIGPAGENLVADAHIQGGDHNACGLGGLGAVMGSKNLKAICCRGTKGSPKIVDPKRLLQLRFEESQLLAPNPGVGAAAGSEIEIAGKKGEARIGVAACYGCQQPCGYSVKYKDGSTVAMGSVKCGEFMYGQAEMEQTGEYIGKNAWRKITQQGLLGITGQASYRKVIQNDITGEHDEPITLLHCGAITEEDLGIPFKYGTPEFADRFNRMVAFREGVGDEIAKGMAVFANEYVGTPEAIRDYELNCIRKGIHGFVPGFWIHLYRSNGLLMRCTSVINSGDTRSMYHYLMPMYEPFQDRATEVGAACANWEWTYAAEATKFMGDFKMSMDTAMRCFFQVGGDAMGPHMRYNQQIHEAISGIPYGVEEEAEYCERIWLLERSIQARQGHTREDDQMFDSVYEDLAEFGVTPEKFNGALDQFYELRNIDPATGLPRKSEYARLGISYIADELENKYGIKLPE